MANHGPSFGLDAELAAKREASLNPQLLTEAHQWIEAVTGLKIGDDFGAGLKDGSILINLINKIQPGSVKGINKGRMPFQLMENIGNYLKACQALGIKATDMFQTVDLFEAKNINQVVQNIHALGRAAQRIGFQGPVIGVKEADKHVQFTQEQLRQGQGELGLLTAGQVKNSYSQVDRSKDVNKLHAQHWKAGEGPQ